MSDAVAEARSIMWTAVVDLGATNPDGSGWAVAVAEAETAMDAFEREIVSRERERARALVEALIEHGVHDDWCRSLKVMAARGPCDCGIGAALAAHDLARSEQSSA